MATAGCLATLTLLWKVPTATALVNNVEPMRLVVNSTSDALRLSWAASQVGTIVDAVVLGSVKFDVLIQVKGGLGLLGLGFRCCKALDRRLSTRVLMSVDSP